MKVLVTGANGFIGRALCAYLDRNGVQVVPVVRRSVDMPNAVILAADDEVNWHAALTGCDAIVHLAGKAAADARHHDLSRTLREANVTSTVCLYQRAAKAKVGRFIFLSTAKVNGECTAPGEFFSPEDIPAPEDAYASSKWRAECQLQVLAQPPGPELVVIRPPLVYGPGVKGNFPVSTSELLRNIASAYQTKARLFCCSTKLLQVCFAFLGKSAQADRLLGSLVLDDAKCYQLLGWVPPLTIEEQLQRIHSATVS